MREELIERFLNFAVEIYKLEDGLCKSYSGKHIYGQLFRSGTSSGANYDEATAAESKKDFVHKMLISFKELRESYFWLRFIEKAKLISENNAVLIALLKENKELLNILGKAVSTTKIKWQKTLKNNGKI
ncbi:MAG: four helix bundle protein [Bacteroidales bacterium]